MSKQYRYDSAARPTRTTTTIDSTSYAVNTKYDSNYGRPLSVSYPNDLTVAYQYNKYGYLTHEQNASSGYVYRRVTAQDMWGNIKAAEIADDTLQGKYLYSARTGQMLSSMVEEGNTTKHHLSYSDYDSFGNIVVQNNLVGANQTKESFVYDALHRLTKSTLSASDYSNATEYGFDAVGNLKKKSDYSLNDSNAYAYQAGTNQLTSVSLKDKTTTVSFDYDEKGNLTHRNNKQEVWYNNFNKPTQITRLGSNVQLYYGSDIMRYKQVRTVDDVEITTHYIGKLYEVETKSGIKTHTSYIGDVAIVKESSEYLTISFTHRDRLGSASTFTDQNGYATLYRSYDPFGAPKGGNWRPLSEPRLSTLSTMPTRRGFTDHEHLDEVELIHMNGRVYDYNVGRFMSVDPFIQEPGNSQSVNPYSYVMNNPLGFTDPTGYIGSRIKDSEGEERDTLAGVKGVTSKNQRGYDATKANAAFNGASVGTPKNGGPEKTVDIEGETSKKEVNLNDDGTSGNQSLLSSAEDGFSSVLNSATETIKSSDLYKDNEMLINFIADEGVDVLLRTGQTVGGAGQVLLGGAICYGSGGLACAAGAVIAVKGGDNIYSGLSGNQSVSENLLQRATGSKTTGTLINAGLDIGTSAIGLMRAAPKINELGQPMRHLMRKDPTLTEASFRQATTTALTVEAATATATVADTLMKLKQN